MIIIGIFSLVIIKKLNHYIPINIYYIPTRRISQHAFAIMASTSSRRNNQISFSAFQRNSINPDAITATMIFERLAKSLEDYGIPADEVPVILDYLTKTKPVKAVAVKPDASDDATFAAASARIRDGESVDDEDKFLTPYQAHVVLLSLTMTVNRIFNDDHYKSKLNDQLFAVFEEFRSGLYAATYKWGLPTQYGIPTEFTENVGRLGLMPKKLVVTQTKLRVFLDAHIAGLKTIGVTIELNPDVIAQASTCTDTEVAIHWSKLISRKKCDELRLPLSLALSAVKFVVPDELTFLPESVIVLLKEHFPNITDLVSAVNTSKKSLGRIDNFKAFAETPLFETLSSNYRFDVDENQLDSIFSMLPKFSRLLHQASINVHRTKSNQTLEIEIAPAKTNSKGVVTVPAKTIALVFPRLMLDFQAQLADGINQSAFSQVLPYIQNRSMLNMTFVSSTVAAILVAAFVTSDKPGVKTGQMLDELEHQFIAHSKNIAEIKATPTGVDKLSLFARGNEIVTNIFTLVHDMYEASQLFEFVSPREVALFTAFFEGVKSVTPNQMERERKPKQAEFQGLNEFDVPLTVAVGRPVAGSRQSTRQTPHAAAGGNPDSTEPSLPSWPRMSNAYQPAKKRETPAAPQQKPQERVSFQRQTRQSQPVEAATAESAEATPSKAVAAAQTVDDGWN